MKISPHIVTPCLGPGPKTGGQTSSEFIAEMNRDIRVAGLEKIVPTTTFDTLMGKRFYQRNEYVAAQLKYPRGQMNTDIHLAKIYGGLSGKRNSKMEVGVLLIDCEKLLDEIKPRKNLIYAIKYCEFARDAATVSYTPLPQNGTPVIINEGENWTCRSQVPGPLSMSPRVRHSPEKGSPYKVPQGNKLNYSEISETGQQILNDGSILDPEQLGGPLLKNFIQGQLKKQKRRSQDRYSTLKEKQIVSIYGKKMPRPGEGLKFFQETHQLGDAGIVNLSTQQSKPLGDDGHSDPLPPGEPPGGDGETRGIFADTSFRDTNATNIDGLETIDTGGNEGPTIVVEPAKSPRPEDGNPNSGPNSGLKQSPRSGEQRKASPMSSAAPSPRANEVPPALPKALSGTSAVSHKSGVSNKSGVKTSEAGDKKSELASNVDKTSNVDKKSEAGSAAEKKSAEAGSQIGDKKPSEVGSNADKRSEAGGKAVDKNSEIGSNAGDTKSDTKSVDKKSETGSNVKDVDKASNVDKKSETGSNVKDVDKASNVDKKSETGSNVKAKAVEGIHEMLFDGRHRMEPPLSPQDQMQNQMQTDTEGLFLEGDICKHITENRKLHNDQILFEGHHNMAAAPPKDTLNLSQDVSENRMDESQLGDLNQSVMDGSNAEGEHQDVNQNSTIEGENQTAQNSSSTAYDRSQFEMNNQIKSPKSNAKAPKNTFIPKDPEYRFYALLLVTQVVDKNGNSHCKPVAACEPIYILRFLTKNHTGNPIGGQKGQSGEGYNRVSNKILYGVPEEIWPLEPVPFGVLINSPKWESLIPLLQYIRKDIEIAAWKSDQKLDTSMRKKQCQSFNTDPYFNTLCLSRPGFYNISAVLPDEENLYLLGDPVPITCVNVNDHAREVEDLRMKLSLRLSLHTISYPFYVLPWNEIKGWIKWKDHSACLDDESLINFSELEVEEGKQFVSIYVSHEYAKSYHPDNDRGDKIKSLQKYCRALISQYGGIEYIDLYIYIDYCCKEWDRHIENFDAKSIEISYIWNSNHFLALVPGLLNTNQEMQNMQTFCENPKCQAECFAASLSGMKHIYWTDGEVGGRFELPLKYPVCWCTHLASQLALYSNLWAQSEEVELGEGGSNSGSSGITDTGNVYSGKHKQEKTSLDGSKRNGSLTAGAQNGMGLVKGAAKQALKRDLQYASYMGEEGSAGGVGYQLGGGPGPVAQHTRLLMDHLRFEGKNPRMNPDKIGSVGKKFLHGFSLLPGQKPRSVAHSQRHSISNVGSNTNHRETSSSSRPSSTHRSRSGSQMRNNPLARSNSRGGGARSRSLVGNNGGCNSGGNARGNLGGEVQAHKMSKKNSNTDRSLLDTNAGLMISAGLDMFGNAAETPMETDKFGRSIKVTDSIAKDMCSEGRFGKVQPMRGTGRGIKSSMLGPYNSGAGTNQLNEDGKTSLPSMGPKFSPEFFEELMLVGDLPTFFKWKKSIALGWFLAAPLTLSAEVVQEELDAKAELAKQLLEDEKERQRWQQEAEESRKQAQQNAAAELEQAKKNAEDGEQKELKPGVEEVPEEEEKAHDDEEAQEVKMQKQDEEEDDDDNDVESGDTEEVEEMNEEGHLLPRKKRKSPKTKLKKMNTQQLKEAADMEEEFWKEINGKKPTNVDESLDNAAINADEGKDVKENPDEE